MATTKTGKIKPVLKEGPKGLQLMFVMGGKKK